jgi:biotin carboxylase
VAANPAPIDRQAFAEERGARITEPSLTARILLTGAGHSPSNNLIRSLRSDSKPPFVVGCHDDRFVLRNSAADRTCLVPPAGSPAWLSALRRIVGAESIDLVIPTLDTDVAALSRARKQLQPRLFLPSPRFIETCRDKYRLIAHLQERGLPAPATFPVESLSDIAGIFRRLGKARPLWCRVRTGAGSLGALPVNSPAQARSWIRYWIEMRGVSADSFLLSEYLPGRDFGCQSLWRDGEMLLVKTYERLSYLGTGSQPAEVSSAAALAKTVFEPRLVDACKQAIRSLDRRASGVFAMDFKENAQGIACITEINAGRFSSSTNIVDLVGRHNMAALFVRAATGGQIALRDEYEAERDWYMLRDIDSPPRIFHASAFFDNIVDTVTAPGSAARRRRRDNKGGSRELHDQAKEGPRPASHSDLRHAEDAGGARAPGGVQSGGERP